MATRVRFLGELAEVPVDTWIGGNLDLVKFRERLALVEVEGQPLGRQRAQSLVERLLVGALDNFGNDYLKAMGEHLDAIVRIRGELKTRFDAVLGHFKAGRPASKLPKRLLDVGELTRIFNELDQHVEAINGRSPSHDLDFYYERNPDARSPDPHSVLNEATSLEDVRAQEEAASAREPEEQAAPEPGLLEHVEEDIPWYLKRGEREKARAAAYRERRALEAQRYRGAHLLPSNAPEVQRARQVLADWSEHALPDGWDSNVHEVADYTEPVAAAFAETGRTDANFAQAHVEVYFKTPDGYRFRPDGVRFLDSEGNRYLFNEHKDPPSAADIAEFTSERGRARMLADMEDDANAARLLEHRGCQGWVYSTSSPEVARMMTEVIAEIRRRSPDLGRLLHAPEVR
jgi:hypothetical protein